jgi:hypothetical protein
VIGTPASWSGSPRFRSRPGDRLSLQTDGGNATPDSVTRHRELTPYKSQLLINVVKQIKEMKLPVRQKPPNTGAEIIVNRAVPQEMGSSL